MNRNVFLLSLLIAIIGGIIILLGVGKSEWLLSWMLGVSLGIYPFLFWGVIRSFVFNKGKSSKRILLPALLLVKFAILGFGLFLLSKTRLVAPMPFLAGFVITTPSILTAVIVNIVKHSEATPLMPTKKY